jgi:hypothetical protein
VRASRRLVFAGSNLKRHQLIEVRAVADQLGGVLLEDGKITEAVRARAMCWLCD